VSPEEEIIRAGEARQILDSRIMLEARKNLEEQLSHLRRAVPIKDADMHTRLILLEQMYGHLMGWFEQIAQTGKMAEIQLREREQQRNLSELNLKAFHEMGRNAFN
jgi:hypothetical protein